MKATCGKSLPSDSCSWRYAKVALPSIDFNWHYHPEYEICLTLDSSGTKHIGDHISYYNGSDLVLLGPNLPHTWHSKPVENESIIVYVAQIPTDWLNNIVNDIPDLSALSELLALSKRGITFSQSTTRKSLDLFMRMEEASPIERYLLLVELLNLMQLDKEAQVLSSSSFKFDSYKDSSSDRINKVVNYIYQHYTEPLNADYLASLVYMSTNHFHRFFKKRTEQTLNQFINQLRIGKACKLLINSDILISAISDQCGFNNISNFNRRFRMIKGATPKEFRKSLKSPSPL